MILKFVLNLCCCVRVIKTKYKEDNTYNEYTESSESIWKAYESSTF